MFSTRDLFRDAISHKFNRLQKILFISMAGVACDKLISDWIIQYNPAKFYEANTLLNPMIGLPILIIDFMICDLILPNSSFYNKILYALSLISWETILHNMLVYFELIDGINMTLALPIIYLFNLSTLILLPHLWKYVNTQFSPNAEA